MAITAIAFECADRDALNAKHAAKIPAICEMLPTAIESRAKTLRFVVAAGFTDSAFKPTSKASASVGEEGAAEVHLQPQHVEVVVADAHSLQQLGLALLDDGNIAVTI